MILQDPAKVAAVEDKGIFTQAGLKVFLGQIMISAQNRCFGVADDDVQPVKKAGIRIVESVLVGAVFQRRLQ